MIGQTISHYKILEKLGEGGMGVVYKAQDTRLDRLVALKFLPEHLVSDLSAKARFIQEAKGASAINHQNITTVHDIGEVDGKSFIAMEYLECRTVKELAKENLKLPQILEIAIQIAEGLSTAHRKEIIHRDIKSDNIKVTKDGVAKIMDFGLAKLKGAPKLTETGSTVGTVAYMSPEQTRGEEIDQRSDIFSLGVVLYELITGRLPFQGEHNAAISYSICFDNPEPLARYTARVPEGLQRIMDKALQKDKSSRYQSASDLLVDLKGLQKEIADGHFIAPPKRKIVNKVSMLAGLTALFVIVGYFVFFRPSTTSGKRPILAILPFRDLGPPGQEYFADTITDEITGNLAKVSGLGVISNTSAILYKKSSKNLRQIGSELGADYVLEGTISWDKSGGASRVRISPQLIRVKDDTHLWAESYDRVFDQIFALQSEVAQKVTAALDVTLLEPERQSIEAKPTENLEAYQYYLQGNDYYNKSYKKKDWEIAIQMYEKAVELDSNFALASAKLALTHAAMYWFYHDRTDERLAKAKEAVDKALGLAPNLPEAHLALGYYYYWGSRDYDRALTEFALAQKSRSNNSEILAAIGYVQRRQGKWEQALANLMKASELDPRSNIEAADVGLTCLSMRNYAEAERYYDRAISIAPDWAPPYADKAWLYVLWEGKTEEARKVLEEAGTKVNSSELVDRWTWLEILDGNYQAALDRLSGWSVTDRDTNRYFGFIADIYGLMNQPQLKHAYFDSARIIREKKVKERPQEASFHSDLGYAYAGLGRKDEAIREGKRAIELLPVNKDANSGPHLLENLAMIYVMVGEYDLAIDQLKYLLSIPARISVPLLRINPWWAPLKNHPRFQQLLAEKN